MIKTEELLNIAEETGKKILEVIEEFKHNKSICEKLSAKLKQAQETLNHLVIIYNDNVEYFEKESYRLAFTNYVEVLKKCLQFLINIQGKGLFIRLVNNDKYKKTFYRLFIDIDQAVSVLNLGLSVKNRMNKSNNDDVLKETQEEMNKIATRLINMNVDVEGHEMERKNLVTDIQAYMKVEENSNEDILKSVEVSLRQLKSIPMALPRKGRRYHVHKRAYNNEVVAEKIFLDKMDEGATLNKIRKEVLILKKLSVCPYIIKFFGVSFRARQIGLVIEYASKGNLKDLLESATELDQTLLFNFTLDIIQGVAFLHEMNIVHKNIKSSSILVNESMSAKISGFEFSRELSSNTTIVTDVGSDRYRWLPPEKLTHTTYQFTTKGDVYSLGMVLWSIWTRRYPYEIMDQKSIEEFVSSGGRENIDLVEIVEIKSIILSCWEQIPDNRPNVFELISELDIILGNTAEFDEQIVLETEDRLPHHHDRLKNSNTIKSLSNLSINRQEISFNNSGLPFPSSPFESLSPSLPSAPQFPSSPLMGMELHIPSAPSAPDDDDLSVSMESKMNIHDQGILDSQFDLSSTTNQYDTQLYDHDLEDLSEDLFLETEQVTFEAALDYHTKGNRKKSYDFFKELVSDCNHPKAAYYLGYYYFWGQDGVTTKNWDLALKYFQISADQNDSDALDHLGVFYASDDNPKKNMQLAFVHYKRAADMGNKKALYHVGVCYAKGRGVKQNRELAMRFIQDAASRGHALAIEQLNKIKHRP